MVLTKKQQEEFLILWKEYQNNCETFLVANEKITPDELDEKRIAVIPQIKKLIISYLENTIDIDEFKTTIDGLNKRYRFWGFRAINGQMFFNMLYKSSEKLNQISDLNEVLRESISIPGDIDEARNKLRMINEYTLSIGQHYDDARSAPRAGSIPFFISYFWQIQDHLKWPVYYSSMVEALIDLDFWSPIKNVEKDYESFFNLNNEFIATIKDGTESVPSYWDIEHVFWYYRQRPEDENINVLDQRHTEVIEEETLEEIALPESYIPPILSIYTLLAKNDQEISEICTKLETSCEAEFEKRTSVLFKMLGFEVEPLGQGHGRVPDGIAYSQEYRYAIIYDAKVRQDGYRMGTDERAIREYISNVGERLRRQGYRNIYLMIISSSFSGDHDSVIRSIKIDTDVREVLLFEASALLKLLEGKLRNPAISLGPDGIQNLLAASGEITLGDIQEFIS